MTEDPSTPNSASIPPPSGGLRYLERLQEKSLGEVGIPPEIYRDAEKHARLIVPEHVLRALDAGKTLPSTLPPTSSEWLQTIGRSALARQPTRLEPQSIYQIILNRSIEIEAAAKKLDLTIPPRLTIGTLPTWQVNARTIAVPDSDEFLVVFDNALFTFASTASKVVAGCFPLEIKPDGIMFQMNLEAATERIERDVSLTRIFERIFIAYLLERNVGSAYRYSLDENYYKLAISLWTSMERFALAHEYGHLIAGHLDTTKPTANLLSGEPVREFVPNLDQECEADAIAFGLYVHAGLESGEDHAKSYVGADLFFSVLDVMDRALSVLRAGDENHRPRGTHPEPAARREALRLMMQMMFGPQDSRVAMYWGQLMERLVEQLWQHSRPGFERLYAAGIKPVRLIRNPSPAPGTSGN